MLRTWLAVVVLVLAVGSISGSDHIVIGVVASLEVVVKVNDVEIPGSPVLVDSLGILCFSVFEAVSPCTVTICGVVTEDRPAVVCKESDR